MASRVDNIIEQTYRQEAGRILAGLIALVDDFTLAEDALQDAVVNALQSWSAEGVPRNPAGWLTTVARRRAIERLRRDETLLRKQPLLEAEMTYMQAEQGTALDAALAHEAAAESIPDERLKLLFTCCHPALALDARIALTLRTLGGLTTEEIASAFLTSTPTMAQRLARAAQNPRRWHPLSRAAASPCAIRWSSAASSMRCSPLLLRHLEDDGRSADGVS